MKNGSKNPGAAIGLDVGTSRIVLAQRNGDEYTYASELNAFVSIPFSRMTVAALEKEGIPHSVENGEIVVHGNESAKFAELMNVDVRRPMTKGTLDPKEPESLKLVRKVIASMAGAGGKEGQKICFTTPAPPIGAQESVTYHESTLRSMLGDMGYITKSINEGLAVIYGELEASNYTGIGISMGGGLCNVALSYLSVPVFSFSIPKAGDYIDSSAAAVLGERANTVRIAKEESFHFNGFVAEKLHQVIGVYYDEMIQAVIAGLKEAFASTRALPKIGRPVPLVLSGGSAMPSGFRDRFEKTLLSEDLPVGVSEVKLAENPLATAAKGALIAALVEM
jgi:hypothetical protein